jgi:hypothetical protein
MITMITTRETKDGIHGKDIVTRVSEQGIDHACTNGQQDHTSLNHAFARLTRAHYKSPSSADRL